jgi:hypothetical protein
MAFTRKTWLWILVSVVGFGVLCIIAVAGFGMYFVRSHVHAGRSTSADAFRAFDEVRAKFKGDKPVYELDAKEHPRQIRQFSEMPTSSTKAEMAWMLIWDPEEERLLKMSMPFWVLRLGRQKIDISSGGFDFQRLQLDVGELQRVGPVLLFDLRSRGGERVLIWTQ